MREKGKWAAGLFFQFFKQRFDFKTKDSNTFKPNLNWNQIGIN
jgi:hypothetical protein